jgi:hypothetical protein
MLATGWLSALLAGASGVVLASLCRMMIGCLVSDGLGAVMEVLHDNLLCDHDNTLHCAASLVRGGDTVAGQPWSGYPRDSTDGYDL